MRRKADARVNDHRNIWRAFASLTQPARIAWTLSRSNGSRPGHKHFATRIHQTPAKNPILGAVREDFETQLDQFSRSLNETKWIWLQVEFIADDLEFYEIGLKQFAGHAGRFDGLTRAE